MLIDDSKFSREILKRYILKANANFSFKESMGGEEAIEIAKANSEIDLVFLDITMADMNGLEVLPALKKINPNLKIIMCSALGQESIILEALKKGAYGYIIKPFTEEMIKEYVVG